MELRRSWFKPLRQYRHVDVKLPIPLRKARRVAQSFASLRDLLLSAVNETDEVIVSFLGSRAHATQPYGGPQSIFGPHLLRRVSRTDITISIVYIAGP